MRLIAAAVSLIATTMVTHGAIIIDNFSSATNDRFANDPQFIANSYNLSGVGIADDGRWVTMVSENVFISSNHYFPSNGTNVTFYAGNDSGGLSINRTVQKSQRVGSSDIQIGTLDAGIGSSFNFYDFATEDITIPGPPSESFANSPYNGADAYMFGKSPTGSFPISQRMSVGRNKLSDWFGSVTDEYGTTDDTIAAAYNSSSDANYLTYEALVNPGDSGGPMMVDKGNGQLTIVGHNWLKFSASGTDYTGFSYLGNYDTDIQGYIDANPVPELKQFSLYFGLIALFWITGRRKT